MCQTLLQVLAFTVSSPGQVPSPEEYFSRVAGPAHTAGVQAYDSSVIPRGLHDCTYRWLVDSSSRTLPLFSTCNIYDKKTPDIPPFPLPFFSCKTKDEMIYVKKISVNSRGFQK